jgi:hypothetical protein
MHALFGHRANVNPPAIVDDGFSDLEIAAFHKILAATLTILAAKQQLALIISEHRPTQM